MQTHSTDVIDHYSTARRRLTVAEYHRMGEAGILGEDDRVELIEGQIVTMSPIGPRHALAVDALMELLIAATVGLAKVRGQNPVTLDGGSEPTPDIAVVRERWRGYPLRHPGPEDVFLIVEVGDSSIGIDMRPKRNVYARAGIQEYWVVDLTRDFVHVHRNPVDGQYADNSRCEPSGVLAIAALPGVTIPARSLFS